jgi:hypothetical protein
MLKTTMKFAAAGAFALAATTAAQANGNVFPATAQTGETAGLARGAPLPEGVYFVNTLSWGQRNSPDRTGLGDPKFLVEIPVIAWSTPWSIFGANFQLLAAAPMAHVSLDTAGDLSGLYNPFLGATLAYDFGGGFGASYTSGLYFNAGDPDVRVRATTWRQDFALSYTGDGWNLTANLIWGITFDSDKNCPGCNGKTANGFNLDLTATKTFGKWEIGAVGFGSRTYDEPIGVPKQRQFAVGPLVGYNFGPVILQTYLTRDIYTLNTQISATRKNNKETRFWTRLIIPLWTPATPAAPLVTKY